MKKTAENRYPHSATLFRFCKEALEIRYQGNVKVIDQDVGAILGYDPADCSHWKKGKKNIRALATLRSIADHLHLDERLLIDIAGGKIGLEEAVFEYRGYGDFTLVGGQLEGLKKEFFRDPSRWQQDGELKNFDELFRVRRDDVADLAQHVLASGEFREAPLYMPEVFQLFPQISLRTEEGLAEPIRVDREGEGRSLKTTVVYRGPEMRPFIRYLVSRELFRFLCESEHEAARPFAGSPTEIVDIHANLFAGMLLIPEDLLRAEVERATASIDLVTQLAETFWVAKALMNKRLSDVLGHLHS